MFIKIRNTDNVIIDARKEDYDNLTDYYSVDFFYNFPKNQPFYYYKWDTINNQVIVNDDNESVLIENRKMYSNLKIIKWIDDESLKHKDFDFTLVLMKDEPLYHKGEKLLQDYLDPTTDELIVRKHYSEIIGDRYIYGEVSPNRILGLQTKIEWYSFDGLVGSTKDQVVKKFNREEEGERKLKKRQRQISNLKGMAMGTAAEPVVDAIYSYYDEEVRFYTNQGISVFADALNSETDPTMLYYLSIPIPKTYDLKLTVDDYESVNGLYRFSIEKDYYNCMIQFITNGISLDVDCDILDTVEYIDFIDNKFIFEIEDENFIKEETEITLNWSNSIKNYIIHEIS